MIDRRAELAKIHVAKKALGLDDDTYRDMLWTVARVRSAKDLDAAGRAKVLDHLKGRGFKPIVKRGNRPGRPHNINSEDRGPLLSKIEALLADAGRSWAYVNKGIVQKRFHVDRIEFCTPEQLRKIVGMLMYDARRRADPGCPKA